MGSGPGSDLGLHTPFRTVKGADAAPPPPAPAPPPAVPPAALPALPAVPPAPPAPPAVVPPALANGPSSSPPPQPERAADITNPSKGLVVFIASFRSSGGWSAWPLVRSVPSSGFYG